jgi:DNA-binding IclR family transcriptional regulator
LLAAAGADLLSTLSSRQLPAYTANTITDVQELRANIASFRRTGLCYDNEEHAEGISAIGTAFVDPLGRTYAVSVPMPTVRYERIRESLEESLIRCRNEIIDAMGS